MKSFFYLIFLVKHFLRLHTKQKLRKEKKREKDIHTYIVQIEEYQAKHSHKAIAAMQLPSM